MFEGFTLEQQRKIEIERGWKPNYSALTYCTAEAVLLRSVCRKDFRIGSIWNYEILVAERTSGAPDCLGKTQGKWGTYVKPTDRNARYAIKRGLKETFGWDLAPHQFQFAGIVGPELYKSSVRIVGNALVLEVSAEQAEATPFEAKLFCVLVSRGLEFVPESSYLKSTKNCRWVKLKQLVADQGKNFAFMYWTMIALAIKKLDKVEFSYDQTDSFGPGEYDIADIMTGSRTLHDDDEWSGMFGPWPPGAR